MNPSVRRGLRWLVAGLAAVLGACAVEPQVPTIRLERVAREVPGADPRWQQADPASLGVRVWRDQRELRPTVGMQLQPGDIVETGPAAAAVIRFSASGSTVLDTGTRVRIGSLEVFFGRVFADVRGFFQTSSDTVVAGVSGTRFLFTVQPNRVTRVAVAEGVVTCTPRAAGWAPVRLQANQALAVSEAQRGQPQPTAADPRELRDAAEWAGRVSRAPAEGWCCVDGRTVPSWSDRCGAGFSSNRGLAEAMCRPAPPPPPPPEPTGYCCVSGHLSEARRGQCYGTFYENLAVARRSCSAPPVIR